MTKVLGTTANIIAVLRLTGSLINICYDYQSTARHASEDMERIRQQLVSFRDVLEYIASIVAGEPHRFPALERLGAPGGPLIVLEAELRTLVTKLEPATGWKEKRRALVWPLKKKDVNQTLSRMEDIKTTIHLALSADQAALILAIQNVISHRNIIVRVMDTLTWTRTIPSR